MKIFIILFCLVLSLVSSISSAQTTINGIVTNRKGQPLPGANVLLLKATDSSLVKGSGVAKDGSFYFENIKPGNYLILSTHVGFGNLYLPPVTVSDSQSGLDLKTLTLVENGEELEQVSVVSRRPMIEQKIDRMIVNVKNSITSAGGTALDILERSPGVIVNRQAGSISMNGKEGVMVMINGKINYMPPSALVQMLANTSAGNIDRIELITTPPANLDAQGNAGYINIVLITDPEFGFNGGFSATMGYGDGINPAASFNFNYRKNGINLFGSYSSAVDKRKPYFANYRRTVNQGEVREYQTETDRYPTRYNHNARLGIDFQLSKKTVIGFLLSGYINRYDMHETVTNHILTNSRIDTIVITRNEEINNWRHAMGNVNFQHTLSEGETFSFDFDYLLYKNNQPFEYINDYHSGQQQFLFTEKVRTAKKTPIQFWVGKMDYTRKLSPKLSLEAGIKGTVSTFDNDVRVERSKTSNWEIDPDYTSFATLKEDIFAGYVGSNLNPDSKTTIKLGLRYEYTNSNLGTPVVKNIVDRHYGSLFPSFFISKKINDYKAVNFSYSRRINRPKFDDMAPFIFFFDPNIFFSGNPALQPSISDNVKFDFTYKRLMASLSYNYDNNSIAGFQSRVDPKTNKQIIYAENLDYLQTVALVVSLPFNITRWWTTQNNVTATWQQANAPLDNTTLKIEQANVNLMTTQTFQLAESFSLELTGFYQSTSIFGRYRVEPYGKVDFGVQKKFKNNNERLRFAVTDVFSTFKYVWVSNTENLTFSKTTLQFSKVTVNLTYSRNFGRNTVKAARSRNTGSMEERGRVQ